MQSAGVESKEPPRPGTGKRAARPAQQAGARLSRRAARADSMPRTSERRLPTVPTRCREISERRASRQVQGIDADFRAARQRRLDATGFRAARPDSADSMRQAFVRRGPTAPIRCDRLSCGAAALPGDDTVASASGAAAWQPTLVRVVARYSPTTRRRRGSSAFSLSGVMAPTSDARADMTVLIGSKSEAERKRCAPLPILYLARRFCMMLSGR
jgi:hypothetical protein